jgi:magnesium transporter
LKAATKAVSKAAATAVSRAAPRAPRKADVAASGPALEQPARSPHFAPGLINNAVYEKGVRIASPETLAGTFQTLDKHPNAIAWIGLYRPTEEELSALAAEFNLHELAIEDAVLAHQRPKIDRYGDTLFTVLRAASYIDETETVDFGELHIFSGTNFVITVRHSESPDLSVVRKRMEQTPGSMDEGTEAILYAILDAVVDSYRPVVDGVANDIDEIETQVFDGDAQVSRRIYELNREVIEFERAVTPLIGIIDTLSSGFADGYVGDKLQQYLRDVTDHVVQTKERIEEFRLLLRDILAVNTSLVGQRQSEESRNLSEASNRQAIETRKISGWAAILFTPTLIAGIYGMNFKNMPELHWEYGYPFAIGLMILSGVILYVIFKRRGWL